MSDRWRGQESDCRYWVDCRGYPERFSVQWHHCDLVPNIRIDKRKYTSRSEAVKANRMSILR
jgi:hypothetical protein